ncbi:alcohol dehydrogenase [Aspergillus nanangensis]|uniref:alcohol dehydrogenase n=1 Tax=Aspergillus nanangensis TaxID=2582783 RepID=A0AAD4CT85_ASPNN|nr:alcohol dehydrogenase [Aspergillus nanangensis]
MSSTSMINRSCTLTGGYGEPYQFTEAPVPTPAPGEAIVRIDFTGVCHGDVYSRDGGGPAPAAPIRPLVGGHEGIGEIISVGEPNQGFAVGDLVGIAWRGQVCKVCQSCREGAENYCEQQQIVGMHMDGTFQRYVAFPVDQLIRIPPSLDRAAACPILCAGVTAYTALRKMQPEAGKWCVIVGASGGLGHLAIQYAKHFGLKVLSIDGDAAGNPEKESFCWSLGSDAYIDFLQAGTQLSDLVKTTTDGGAHYVLVFSPHQSAYDAAGDYTRFGGQIMAVGIGNCHISLRPILRKNLIVRSNQTGTKADIEEAMRISASGKVKPKVQLMSLASVNEALGKVKAGGVLGKLVLDVSSNVGLRT